MSGTAIFVRTPTVKLTIGQKISKLRKIISEMNVKVMKKVTLVSILYIQ
jgi:hypothetical protein